MMKITQCQTDRHKSDLRALLKHYFEWGLTFNDADTLDNAPTFEDFQKEFANLPDIYAPEHGGGFYMAYVDDALAGCIALKKVDDTTCELKRMFVYPEYRGQQIGWQLLHHLLKHARAMNYQKIVLDSHISMTKAHNLYHAAGFKTVPTPADFPEKLKPIVIFMELELTT